MFVSLYTSRIVLATLGNEDYGIYNVVGGIVVMFTFLNGAMSTSTSRFLTMELGRGNAVQLGKIFSATLSIHICIALVIFVLAETVGLWFVLNKLVIPAERMTAALWVYQCSILSCMVQLTQVPYNACIIAHERMNIYAYVGFVDVFFKLFIVFMLTRINSIDRLQLYAVLILCVSLIVAMIYRIYCKRKYVECVYRWEYNGKLYSELIRFSGWSLLSNLSWVLTTQGSNILLNLYFGPIVNAARAIAVQVDAAVAGFVGNFRTAVNPQIFKLCAGGEKEKMFSLLLQSAKYSYFILLIIILPIFLEVDFILRFWLKSVPNDTPIFVQLTLLYTLIQVFDASFIVVLQAVGKIKLNALFSLFMSLCVLGLSCLFFSLGYGPKLFYYLFVFNAFILSFIIKPILLCKLAGLRFRDFIDKVVVPVVKVTTASCLIPFVLTIYFPDDIARFFIIGCVSVLTTGLSVLYIDMNRSVRRKLFDTVMSKIK